LAACARATNRRRAPYLSDHMMSGAGGPSSGRKYGLSDFTVILHRAPRGPNDDKDARAFYTAVTSRRGTEA